MMKKPMLLVLAVPALIAADRRPEERVVSGKGLIDVRVNGEPAVLRIDPAAPAMPLIRRELAESARLKMKGSWGIGIGYSVGSETINSRTQVVRVDLGGGAQKRRIGWTSRPFANAADGSVGPGALPEPIVRFQLRDPAPGERSVTLPMQHDTPMLGLLGNFTATFGLIEVGGAPMRVRFDPYHPRSLVTAGAGARLAAAQGGVVSGEAVPTEIFFGVARPVRTLTLRRPLAIGPLTIPTLGIRTGDYGSAARIREADAADAAADPDEIIVTGKGGKRDIRRDTLSLGADYLSRCSSITFDRRAKVIRLSCS